MKRMLTDKAKIDFEKWHKENYSYASNTTYPNQKAFNRFLQCNLILKNALIIEWFESSGFLFDKCSVDMCYKIWTEDNWEKEPIIVDCTYIENRKNWVEEAIQKANELYNTTHP